MRRKTLHAIRNMPHVIALAVLLVLAAPAAAQEPTPEPTYYVVQRGDTLYSIAQQFDTTVEAIAAANEIANPSLIVTGQRLVIPTEQPAPEVVSELTANVRVHPAYPGETLPALAFRYGTTVWALREVNDVNRLGLLWPGQELIIPPAVVTTTITPAFPEISADPASAAQGSTMAIQVQGKGELELSGQFLDQNLTFVEEEGRYWALVGVGALMPPGHYPLTLTVTELDSGDLLTMREVFSVTAASFPKYNIVVPSDRQELLASDLVEAERKKVNQVFGQESAERQWEGLFSPPLEGEPRITAPFGQRRSYNDGPVSSYHAGQDLGADKGTPIGAPITGTVVLAEPLQVRGQAVILDHGLGVFTGFWHLSQIDVEVGQVMSPGEVVGRVGSSGLSTGPHLHWEMRVHGVPVDPLQWTRRAFP